MKGGKHFEFSDINKIKTQDANKEMVQGRPVLNLVNLTAWLTGILVSLAVGFGMVEKVLVIKWIPEIITVVAGWIVVVLTIVSIVLAIANKL